jgi:hypothetical protein
MEHIKHLSLGWLVGAAALLLAGCSSEDGVMEEQTPQQPAQTQATIHVTVGAGISDGEATTRSTVTKDGSTRTLQFTAGDRLYVWGQKDKIYDQFDTYYCEYVVAGTLELVAIDSEDPTKATFSGDLSVYRAEVQGDYAGGTDILMTLYGVTYPDGNLVSDLSGFLQSADPLAGFENVKATLIHEDAAEDEDYFISEDDRMVSYRPDCAATVEELMTTELWVSGDYDSGTKSFALAKDTDQPIVNCTISGLEAGVSYKVDYIYGATAAMSDHTKTLYSSMEATSGTLSFAFIAETGDKFHGIRLTNTADAGDTYDVSIGQKEFESKVYNLSRIWYDGAMHRLVDLDGVTKTTHPEGLTLKDGDVVKGLLNGYSKISQRLQISIADGATVILKGVVIRGDNDTRYMWAGLTCLGDATIILADGSENTVKGFNSAYPGIFIAEGKTLTIRGSGSLAASPYDGGTTNSYGAGIGGASGVACGNIVIEGGDITAKGGSNAAGIGGGRNVSCGTITISGGTVNATGYINGAGIGSGYGSSTKPSTCGDITISGTANVTAKSGSGAGIGSGTSGIVSGTISISGSANVTAKSGSGAGIGSGYEGSCNAINITGGTVTAKGGTANAAAGIGSGYYGSCGAIVIGSGITKVVATKGGINSAHIGASANGSCGTVTIDGVAGATTSSTFTHLTSAVSGNTWTLTNPSN